MTTENVALTDGRLGDNLRRAIRASGLTQAEVAERCEMDPTSLSKALAGKRRISSLELALICTATGSDVFGVLDSEPFHGPSYRQGYAEAMRDMRGWIERGDSIDDFLYMGADLNADGDYNGCGAEKDGLYCDLPIHAWPQTHHASVWWENLDEQRSRDGS